MMRPAWIGAAAPFARLIAGGTLAFSGYLKAVRPPEVFAASLESYWLLPVSLVLPLAKVIPWLELLTGLALLAGYGTRAAAAVSTGLYAAFIVFLSQSLLRGLQIADCGCFGGIGPRLTPVQGITMDAALLLLSLLVFLDKDRRWTLDRWTGLP